MLLYISSHNYPGGTALMKLQDLESAQTTPAVNLHIDVFSAQTGISRFLQCNDAWTYNKTEDLSIETLKTAFTHLLVESKDVDKYVDTHEIMQHIEAYSGPPFINYHSFPPVQFNFSPAVTILRKK